MEQRVCREGDQRETLAVRKRRSRQIQEISSPEGHSQNCKVMGRAECV